MKQSNMKSSNIKEMMFIALEEDITLSPFEVHMVKWTIQGGGGRRPGIQSLASSARTTYKGPQHENDMACTCGAHTPTPSVQHMLHDVVPCTYLYQLVQVNCVQAGPVEVVLL